MTIDPVPPVLNGVVEAMSIQRRAGMWELKIDERAQAEAPLVELVEPFINAFPNARFARVERYDDAGDEEWSADQGTTIEQMLAAGGYGFEAILDLALFWELDGELRESAIPGAAELFFTREVPTITLTIWPNLFTDTVALPERIHGDFATPRYQPRTAEWPAAAARNRERLESSLRAWEQLSGGEIVLWTSDRVEEVARYGFPPTAEARDT